jgi:hypothetical protein
MNNMNVSGYIGIIRYYWVIGLKIAKIKNTKRNVLLKLSKYTCVIKSNSLHLKLTV